MPIALRRSFLALGSLLALSSSGCALVDLIDGDPVATVRFFTTHAGTPDENGYPDYGDSETTRVFTNDMGWLISLSDVHVTTADVQLVRCNESQGTPIEMFWGPCPESYISTDDLESVPLGAVTIADGEFCRVDVEFGPFVAPPGGDDHIAPGNPLIRDNTVVVVGVARRGDPPMQEEHPFMVVSDAVLRAELDISKLELGEPVRLQEESFPRDLTIIKNYDRFFDGIDFANTTPEEIEAAVLAAIERDAKVFDGTYD